MYGATCYMLLALLSANPKTLFSEYVLKGFKNSLINIARPNSTNDIVLCVSAVEGMHVFMEVESLRMWLFCSELGLVLHIEGKVEVDRKSVDTHDSRWSWLEALGMQGEY
jgi:hypothetical protein